MWKRMPLPDSNKRYAKCVKPPTKSVSWVCIQPRRIGPEIQEASTCAGLSLPSFIASLLHCSAVAAGFLADHARAVAVSAGDVVADAAQAASEPLRELVPRAPPASLSRA